jgi:hypothetical protein
VQQYPAAEPLGSLCTVSLAGTNTHNISLCICDDMQSEMYLSISLRVRFLQRRIIRLWSYGMLCHIINSFYLASLIATTVTLEQVTSFNTSFLKSFCPEGLKD